MLFRYKGTKNLKVPILGPQLAIPAYQADPKVCVARCMKAYLDRSADFDHQDRVWCCTVKKDGAYPAVSIRGDTLRGWMRRVMTRCGVDPVFTARFGRRLPPRPSTTAGSPLLSWSWVCGSLLPCGTGSTIDPGSPWLQAPLLFVPACEVNAGLCPSSRRLVHRPSRRDVVP